MIEFCTSKDNQAIPNFGFKKPNYEVDFSQKPGHLSAKLPGKSLRTYALSTLHLRFFNLSKLSQ